MKYTIQAILIITMLSPIWVVSCSCLPHIKFDGSDYLAYTDIFEGKVSNLIFKGNVWDTTETRFFSLYEFVVEKNYKGVQPDTVILKLSLSNGANCTKDMKVGESWFIFSSYSDSTYYVSGCSWSHQTSYRPDLMKQAIEYVTNYSALANKQIKLPFHNSDCNCQMFYRGTLSNGQTEGEWETLDSLGGVLEKGVYHNGKEDGLWEYHFLDSNNLALPQISGKRFYKGKNLILVSYGWNGQINYVYVDDSIEIPEGVFTKEELEAITRTKAKKEDLR